MWPPSQTRISVPCRNILLINFIFTFNNILLIINLRHQRHSDNRTYTGLSWLVGAPDQRPETLTFRWIIPVKTTARLFSMELPIIQKTCFYESIGFIHSDGAIALAYHFWNLHGSAHHRRAQGTLTALSRKHEHWATDPKRKTFNSILKTHNLSKTYSSEGGHTKSLTIAKRQGCLLGWPWSFGIDRFWPETRRRERRQLNSFPELVTRRLQSSAGEVSVIEQYHMTTPAEETRDIGATVKWLIAESSHDSACVTRKSSRVPTCHAIESVYSYLYNYLSLVPSPRIMDKYDINRKAADMLVLMILWPLRVGQESNYLGN